MYRLRTKDVCDLLGVSKTTFYEIVKSNPDFPKPIHYTKGTLRYSESEVKAWAKKFANEERNGV